MYKLSFYVAGYELCVDTFDTFEDAEAAARLILAKIPELGKNWEIGS